VQKKKSGIFAKMSPRVNHQLSKVAFFYQPPPLTRLKTLHFVRTFFHIFTWVLSKYHCATAGKSDKVKN
jgi:hypothetical protein